MTNTDSVRSAPEDCQGQPHSILLTLLPLGVVFLKREKKRNATRRFNSNPAGIAQQGYSADPAASYTGE